MKRTIWGSLLVIAAGLALVGCSGAEAEGRAPEDTVQSATPDTGSGAPATNPNPTGAPATAPATSAAPAAGSSAPADPAATSGTPQGEGPSGTAGTTNPTGGVEPGASGEAEKPKDEAKKITGVPADAAQRMGAGSSGSTTGTPTGGN